MRPLPSSRDGPAWQGGWSESTPRRRAGGGGEEMDSQPRAALWKSWKPRDASEQSSQIRTQVVCLFLILT